MNKQSGNQLQNDLFLKLFNTFLITTGIVAINFLQNHRSINNQYTIYNSDNLLGVSPFIKPLT